MTIFKRGSAYRVAKQLVFDPIIEYVKLKYCGHNFVFVATKKAKKEFELSAKSLVVKFYRFPKNAEPYRQWLKICEKSEKDIPNFKISRNSRKCSEGISFYYYVVYLVIRGNVKSSFS